MYKTHFEYSDIEINAQALLGMATELRQLLRQRQAKWYTQRKC